MAARPALVAGPIRFAKGCSCTAVRSPRPANAVCTWLGRDRVRIRVRVRVRVKVRVKVRVRVRVRVRVG